MPLTKNAYIRYLELDKCLGTHGRRYTFSELHTRVNERISEANGTPTTIGRTQLYKDLNYLEFDLGADIVKTKSGRHVYYSYEDPSFSIRNNALTPNEAEQVHSALTVLSRFEGLPQFEWLDEIVASLEDRFPVNNENSSNKLIFDSNEFYSGTIHIKDLLHAISDNRVLNITYKDFKALEPYEIIFHPYILKQYNNRWFCFGLNHTNKIVTWNLALDRIVEIKRNEDISYIKSETDWLEYFDEIIGVTRPDAFPENIELKVSPTQYLYIESKPLHPTQKVIDKNEEHVVIQINVIPNYELISMILSFGASVTVLSPIQLKEQIKDILNLSQTNYNNDMFT